MRQDVQGDIYQVEKRNVRKGCGKSGMCTVLGCTRLSTVDWLSLLDIEDPEPFDCHEVSFKNGATKGFFRNARKLDIYTGQWVVVDTGNGRDVGLVTLSGELARLQMKKKGIEEEHVEHNIIRHATEQDLRRMEEARQRDKEALIKARVIIRSLGLDMSLGDVQYQADLRKATFYYTAKERVDFRELVKKLAREFRIKVEMRQIGVRQESARIGGLGSCGRELCCSTWLTEFKSVSTSAARYQNLVVNPSKLTGQCGRLKCCLNYELDTYLEALLDFPLNADVIKLKEGHARLVKMDIFKGLMYYVKEVGDTRSVITPLTKEQVRELVKLNEQGIYPADLKSDVKTKVEGQEGRPKTDLDSLSTEFVLELDEIEKETRSQTSKKSSGKKQTSGQEQKKKRRRRRKPPHNKTRKK